MQERTDRAYIGDGVYVSFDGWNIWLETERDDQLHSIAIEPPVLEALNDYFVGIKRKYQRKENPDAANADDH